MLQRELERDQHGGAERRDGDRVAPARDERDGDGEDQRRGERDAAAGKVVEPPDRERRAAVGLEAERAVVERPEAVAERDRREREAARAAKPTAVSDARRSRRRRA